MPRKSTSAKPSPVPRRSRVRGSPLAISPSASGTLASRPVLFSRAWLDNYGNEVDEQTLKDFAELLQDVQLEGEQP